MDPWGNPVIVASAGTGKTTLIVETVARLVGPGISPHPPVPGQRILCVTFSRKAASDLQRRIDERLAAEGTPGGSPWVGTVHGLAWRILSAHAAEIGFVRTPWPRGPEEAERRSREWMRQAVESALRRDNPRAQRLLRFAAVGEVEGPFHGLVDELLVLREALDALPPGAWPEADRRDEEDIRRARGLLSGGAYGPARPPALPPTQGSGLERIGPAAPPPTPTAPGGQLPPEIHAVYRDWREALTAFQRATESRALPGADAARMRAIAREAGSFDRLWAWRPGGDTARAENIPPDSGPHEVVAIPSASSTWSATPLVAALARVGRLLGVDMGPRRSFEDPAVGQAAKPVQVAYRSLMDPLASHAAREVAEDVAAILRVFDEARADDGPRSHALHPGHAVAETLRLFARRADLLDAWRSRHDLILVDEDQDLDPAQIVLLRALAAAPGSPLGDERNAPPPRPGALIRVGDPKQAIYGFRGARGGSQVAVRLDGKVETLLDHWRSTPELTHFFNRLFADDPPPRRTAAEAQSPHFPPKSEGAYGPRPAPEGPPAGGERVPLLPVARADSEARAFRQLPRGVAPALRCCRTDPPPPWAGLSAWEASAGAEEAGGVARRVAQLLAAHPGLSANDITLLLPAMTHAPEYRTALAQRGLPSRLLGGRRLGPSRDVRDVWAMLRLLRDPDDRMAMLTVLRSPLVGLSDAGLWRLWASNPEVGARLRRALPWPPDNIPAPDSVSGPTLSERFPAPPNAQPTDQDLDGPEGDRGNSSCDQQPQSRIPSPNHDAETWTLFVERYHAWRAAAHRLPLDDMARRIVEDTHFAAIVAQLTNGNTRTADLWAAIDRLGRVLRRDNTLPGLAFDGPGGAFGAWTASGERHDLDTLLDEAATADMVEEGETDADGDATIPSTPSGIRISTIHQAKGLEFAVVFLAGLGRRRPPTDLPIFDLVPVEDRKPAPPGEPKSARVSLAVRLPLPETEGYWDTADWRAARDRRLAADAAERDRLLYVAITRARDRLELFLPPPPKTESRRSRATGTGETAWSWPERLRTALTSHGVVVVPTPSEKD